MKSCVCGASVPDSFWYCPRCNNIFATVDNTNKRSGTNKCPECDAPTIFQEGCEHCPACGWSKCG